MVYPTWPPVGITAAPDARQGDTDYKPFYYSVNVKAPLGTYLNSMQSAGWLLSKRSVGFFSVETAIRGKEWVNFTTTGNLKEELGPLGSALNLPTMGVEHGVLSFDAPAILHKFSSSADYPVQAVIVEGGQDQISINLTNPAARDVAADFSRICREEGGTFTPPVSVGPESLGLKTQIMMCSNLPGLLNYSLTQGELDGVFGGSLTFNIEGPCNPVNKSS
jgi:hypothetical protein